MSRFADVVWLGRTSAVARLSAILDRKDPFTTHRTPYVPDMAAPDALAFVSANYASKIKKGTLLVGLERGGLVACCLQRSFPALALSVVAVNSPTREGDLVTMPAVGNPGNRLALFSSAYKPISGRCDWDFTAQAYDVGWLRDGVDNAFYPVSYLVSAFMRGSDMKKEVALMFPATV
jgi:hypothetical protein